MRLCLPSAEQGRLRSSADSRRHRHPSRASRLGQPQETTGPAGNASGLRPRGLRHEHASQKGKPCGWCCCLWSQLCNLLMVCAQRLMRDFKRLSSDPPTGVNGSPNSDNIMHWNAVIFGPDDTPWDGGEPDQRHGQGAAAA